MLILQECHWIANKISVLLAKKHVKDFVLQIIFALGFNLVC